MKVKLEAEIIKLQTCKVQLREYLAVKAKIDSKVDEQDRLRKRRDVSQLLHTNTNSVNFCTLQLQLNNS